MSTKTAISRTLTGVVVSDKMKNTVVLEVERRVKHKKYEKYIKRTTRVHAHDEGNKSHVGDIVIVKECRPISKTKNWMLVEIKKTAEISE